MENLYGEVIWCIIITSLTRTKFEGKKNLKKFGKYTLYHFSSGHKSKQITYLIHCIGLEN